MHILVVGLNHRTAPVEIREQFSIAEADLPEALKQLKKTKSVLECVIVSTCNRTEIYAVVDRLHMCGHFIRNFMEKWFDIPRSEFTPFLYIYEDEKALEHLFRVSCGLDSMIIGETQILGQIRDAFLLAQQHQTTEVIFNTLFKQAITLAKRAHSETSIGENAVSVSYAAVELGKRIFGQFSDKKVMLIGAGKMSELALKNLHSNGLKRIVVANRTLSRAENLAQPLNGIAISMDEMEQYIHEVDIIISSTGSSDYVLTYKQLESVMHKRKNSPLFLIDIAVPRDIDPQIGELPNVFLYDIDDLEGIVQSNLDQRRTEAEKIEVMIQTEIANFQHWYKTLGVGPVIRALQEKANHIHQETMNSLFNKLPELTERERKVIRKLSKSILNQILHDPIARIKELAADRNGDEALQMFSHLFALEEIIEQQQVHEKLHKRIEEHPNQVNMTKQKLIAHS